MAVANSDGTGPLTYLGRETVTPQAMGHAWSPDGKTIIAKYIEEHEAWLFDPRVVPVGRSTGGRRRGRTQLAARQRRLIHPGAPPARRRRQARADALTSGARAGSAFSAHSTSLALTGASNPLSRSLRALPNR